jgi:hypothetical protein
MSITIVLNIGTSNVIALSPSQISDPVVDISSYSMDSCSIATNILVVCGMDESPGTPNILNFTNNSGTEIVLTIYIGPFISINFIPNGITIGPFENVTHYTTEPCPPPAQTYDILKYMQQHPGVEYTITNMDPDNITFITSGTYTYTQGNGLTLVR